MALITNDSSDLQRDKLKALGIEPEKAWHVGDSLDTDIAGARAASLTAVRLNRTGQIRHESQPEPYFEIRTLASLTAILKFE